MEERKMKIAKIRIASPVSLPLVEGGNRDYGRGYHEVDASILDHWFVKGLINAGTVVVESEKTVSGFKSLPKEEAKPIIPNVPDDKYKVGTVSINIVDKKEPLVDVSVEEVSDKPIKRRNKKKEA
jgi:hypothetical protein